MKFTRTTIVAMTSVIGICCILFFFIAFNPKKEKALEMTFADNWFFHEMGTDTLSNCVSFLLTKDKRIFYYCGKFSDAKNKVLPELKETSFENKNGIDSLLQSIDSFTVLRMKKLYAEKIKNNWPDSTYNRKKSFIQGDWKAKVYLIKTDANARYNEFIKLVDELKLLRIGKFVNVDITISECDALQKATAKN